MADDIKWVPEDRRYTWDQRQGALTTIARHCPREEWREIGRMLGLDGAEVYATDKRALSTPAREGLADKHRARIKRGGVAK